MPEAQQAPGKQDVLVIGAGPVGLAAAVLLAKQGHRVTVYEGRPEIPDNLEESYPIGINPRTLHCLELIDPVLAAQAREEGKLVDAWQIFAGDSMVADLRSGTVYGTTRGGVNKLLYSYSQGVQGVSVVFNHKLAGIDFDSRELVFDVYTGSSKSQVHVPAKHARVLAADGVRSGVRRAMEQRGLVYSQVTPWPIEFRVLFSKPGATSKGLDPKVHYIFGGHYAAVVKKGDLEMWTLVMGIKDVDSDETRELLLAEEASDENVAKLRALLEKQAPRASPIIDDDELRRFFGRRTFRGAVVKVDVLHHEEWLLLLGDAAHSVLPPTGEGVNSGLEDCAVLAEVASSGSQTLFSSYNDCRMPDLDALHRYAVYQNEGLKATGPDAASRLMVTILQSLAKKAGLIANTFEDMSFGPKSLERRPYREIGAMWAGQIGCLLPLARTICYSCYFGCLCFLWCPRRRIAASVDQTLKPPAGVQ